KSAITNYVYYYNNKRIKTKLAGRTPVQYRNLSDQLAAKTSLQFSGFSSVCAFLFVNINILNISQTK
ncbi:IS3 family transposase, partial [Weissella confusa]|nr:IS3 family transposase [Weissella confusa]MBJ7699745.1 IS3 family transposase [Weissella confusa]